MKRLGIVLLVTVAVALIGILACAETVRILLGSHMDYLIAAAELFEERFGVEVEIDLVTTPDLRTKIVSSLVARRSPWDVIFITSNVTAELADLGWLVNLSDRVPDMWAPESQDQEDLFLNAFAQVAYNGDEYAVPVTIGAPMLIWNKKLMADAGLDPEAPYEWHSTPGAFDEFLSYAAAMSREVDGIQHYGYTDNWSGEQIFYFFNYQVQARGGDLYAEDGTPQVDSQEALDALNAMVSMYNDLKCVDPAAMTYTWCFDSGAPFWDGTRGMILSWPFMVGVSMNPEQSKIPSDMVGAAPPPAVLTSASTDGSEFLAIPAYANNVQRGWQFILFATSKEMQKQQAITTGWAPIWADLLVDEDVVANQPWAPVVVQQYEYPVNVYPSPYATERRQTLADELMKAILLEQTPEQALQNAQAALLKIEE